MRKYRSEKKNKYEGPNEDRNGGRRSISSLFNKERVTKAVAGILITAAILFNIDRQLAPYDPILGHGNYNKSPSNTLVTRISIFLQKQLKNPLQGITGTVAHRLHRLVQKPKLIPHYGNEFLQQHLTKDIPPGTKYSELIQDLGNENIIKEQGFVYGKFVDRVNYHHIQTLTAFYPENADPQLLLAPKITGTTVSPNLYLAIPDPNQRSNRNNWTFIGNNPEASHTNAVAVKFQIPCKENGVHEITFGAGWLQPNPNNDMNISVEDLKKSTLFYGQLYPGNLAIPATGIMEIRRNESGRLTFITHNIYAGSIEDDDNPPLFLYMRNDGKIETLRGKEILDLQNNPKQEGIIVQIANVWNFNEDQIKLVNEGIKQQDTNSILNTLNNIHASIPIKQEKDTTWMIVAETDTSETILSFALNMNNESEKTPGSYKIVASIQEIIELAKNRGVKIKNLKIIHTGAEGSTSNLIISEDNKNLDQNNESMPTAFEILIARQVFGVYLPDKDMLEYIRKCYFLGDNTNRR